MTKIAMVPARVGSTRLKMKNMALIGGRPLIAYAIEAARDSGVFDRVIVNSDHPVFGKVAGRYGAEFYLRPPELGASDVKSDDVVDDFMAKHPSDIVAWVNPTSPLQTGKEIREVVEHFVAVGADSLITVKDERVHAVFEGRPVNFQIDEPFAQTQDLVPVQPFVYSIMMWRNATFRRVFAARGYAVLCGKVGYYPVSKESAIIIKTKEDLRLAEYVLRARSGDAAYEVAYDELAESVS